jgi:5'-deoxynucleotidase YfbR-like HD superfamily hydrolase
MSKTPEQLWEVYTAFAESEHGQQLATQVRFERYNLAGVSNERWIELLGRDVNNLEHMPLTNRLTWVMIERLRESQPDLLDEGEEELLLVAAMVHDWGEAIVGDTTYSEKTDDHETEERKAVAEILSAFEDEEMEGMIEMIEYAATNIVFNAETKLGKIFNTIERIGYIRTAMRACRIVEDEIAPECNEGLKWLIADVMGNHVSVLLDRIADYPTLYDYFFENRSDLGRTFNVGDKANFKLFKDRIQEKKEAFHEGWNKLSAWKADVLYKDPKFARALLAKIG